jgi:hypothetical protein
MRFKSVRIVKSALPAWCRGRVCYGELARQFDLDGEYLADLKVELNEGLEVAAEKLRATTRPARLWQRQEKKAGAHHLLAPVYYWCTAG